MADQGKTGRAKRSRLGRGLSALVDTPVVVEPDSVPTPTTKHNPNEKLNHDSASPISGGASSYQTAEKGVAQHAGSGFDERKPGAGVIKIPAEHIGVNRDQPRRVFDETKLKELSASILEHGLMQPIVVRQMLGNERADANDGIEYELIAGERRWRACQLAGMNEIPALVREADDATSAQLAMIENIQREDLNAIDLALGYRALMDRYTMTQEQISKKVGVSRSSIANTVRLLDLPDEVRTLVADGKLSAGHAKVLLSLDHPNLQQSMGVRCLQEGWSVRKLEAECKNTIDGAETRVDSLSNDLKSDDLNEGDRAHSVLRDLEKRVSEELGTRVQIRTDKSRTRGRVVIEFYDLDQFDGLLGRLGVKAEG